MPRKIFGPVLPALRNRPQIWVVAAVAAALLDPDHHTADLGGRATTTELGSAVLEELEEAQ